MEIKKLRSVLYWIVIGFGIASFIISILAVYTGRLYCDELLYHVIACIIFGMISAALQVIIFEKEMMLILFEKCQYYNFIDRNKCWIEPLFKLSLFLILAVSTLLYIFNNPKFVSHPIVSGVSFWISNLIFVEICTYFNNKYVAEINGKLGAASGDNSEINFSGVCIKFVPILMGLIISYALWNSSTIHYIHSISVGVIKPITFSLGHFISSLLVGGGASILYLIIKNYYLAKIDVIQTDDGKRLGRISFIVWILIGSGVFYYCDTPIGALIVFCVISVFYFLILEIIFIAIFNGINQFRCFSVNSFCIAALFFLLFMITFYVLSDYPEDTFFKISMTNFSFWISNILLPLLPVFLRKLLHCYQCFLRKLLHFFKNITLK